MVERYRGNGGERPKSDPLEAHARRLYAAQMERYAKRIGREREFTPIPFDRLDPVSRNQWIMYAKVHKSEVL